MQCHPPHSEFCGHPLCIRYRPCCVYSSIQWGNLAQQQAVERWIVGLYLLWIVYESSQSISWCGQRCDGLGSTPISAEPSYRGENGNKWLDCRMYGKYGVAWNETNRYVWPGVGTENVERILQLHIWLMILVWLYLYTASNCNTVEISNKLTYLLLARLHIV